MRINDFSNILKNPKEISLEQVREITAILEEYPYFHAARALHLKILYAQKDYKYNKALKVAAAHITNRTVLFDFINSHANADDFLKSEKQEQNYPLSGVKEKYQMPAWFYDISVISEEIAAKETADKANSEILQEKKDENFSSCSQKWLEITRYHNLNENKNKKNKFELIDQFLETNPKIEPSKNYTPSKNISTNSEPKQSMLMTETLAKIYLEQEKFQEAIQAYEILILKNPEKSGFFADQIRAIKNLQQNNL